MKSRLLNLKLVILIGVVLGLGVLKGSYLTPLFIISAFTCGVMLLKPDMALIIMLLGYALFFQKVRIIFVILTIIYFTSVVLKSLSTHENEISLTKKDYAFVMLFIIGLFSTLRAQDRISEIFSFSFFYSIMFLSFSFFFYFVIKTHINSFQLIKKIMIIIVIMAVCRSIEGLVYYRINPSNLPFGELTTTGVGTQYYIELLFTSLPICFVLMLHEKTVKKKLIIILGMLIIFSAMILTFQKTLFVIMILFTFYGLSRYISRIFAYILQNIIPSLILISIIILGFSKHLYNIFINTYNHLFSPQLNIYTSTWKGRLVLWESGLRAFPDNPFFGGGLLMTPSVIERYLPYGFPTHLGLHNVYLTFLLEAGILGFIFYITIIILTLHEIRICKNRLKEAGEMEMYNYMTAMQIAFIAQLIYNISTPAPYFILFWLFTGLSAAIFRMLQHKKGSIP